MKAVSLATDGYILKPEFEGPVVEVEVEVEDEELEVTVVVE